MVLCSIQLYNQCTDFRVGSYLVLRYSAGYSDVVLCIGAAMLGVRGYKAGIWLKA